MGAQLLTNELMINHVILEERSRNTWENAFYTKAFLEQRGISHIALVTHGYHMRRASYSFDRAGIPHTSMPTGFISNQFTRSWLGSWLPSTQALNYSRLALHEYLGLIFYRLKQPPLNAPKKLTAQHD